MAGRGEGAEQGEALSYDELYERLLSSYPSISLDDLYDDAPNLEPPFGVTHERVLMLMEQQGRRTRLHLQELALAFRAGQSSDEVAKVFPIPPDPAKLPQGAADERAFETEAWWKD